MLLKIVSAHFIALTFFLTLHRPIFSSAKPTPSFVTTPAMRANIAPDLVAPKTVPPPPLEEGDFEFPPPLTPDPSVSDETNDDSFVDHAAPSVLKPSFDEKPPLLLTLKGKLTHHYRKIYPFMLSRPPPTNSEAETRLTGRFITFVDRRTPYVLLAIEYSFGSNMWNDLLYLTPHGYLIVELKVHKPLVAEKQALRRKLALSELTNVPVYYLAVTNDAILSDLPDLDLLRLKPFHRTKCNRILSNSYGIRAPSGIFYPSVDKNFVNDSLLPEKSDLLPYHFQGDSSFSSESTHSSERTSPFSYLLSSDSYSSLVDSSSDELDTVVSSSDDDDLTIVSSSDDDDDSHQTHAIIDLDQLADQTANLVIDFLRPYAERVAILEASNLELSELLDALQKSHVELHAAHKRHVSKVLADQHYLLAKATAKRRQMNWDYIESYKWNHTTNRMDFVIKPGCIQAAALFATR